MFINLLPFIQPVVEVVVYENLIPKAMVGPNHSKKEKNLVEKLLSFFTRKIKYVY